MTNTTLPDTERLPCAECSNTILPTTAERTGGVCMPCFQEKRGERRRVILTGQGPGTVEVIKAVRVYGSLGLAEAKRAVESVAQQPLELEVTSLEKAKALTRVLLDAGFSFEVHGPEGPEREPR